MADMAACIRQSDWFRPRMSQISFFFVEVDPNSLCPRIEDIEGNCKDDGLKRVRSICRQLITVTILIAHVTTST
ncbi:unnamed protein product [Brassica rapa]|uniref:Uncharacterized protein n=1 Tax=Brassica campestris TaxID=3711 RepID=A0A8D9LU03_BRACM|nr:unnamed protein product [Brassica rapa]